MMFEIVNVVGEHETETADDSKCHAEWSENPTKLLIHLYKIKKELVESRKIKTMKRMWETINDELNNHGYSYTATQCESKWKSLERAYRNKLKNMNKTGRGRKSCPYERELAAIVKPKTNVFSPCLMDNGTIISDIDHTPESNELGAPTVKLLKLHRNTLNTEIKELRQAIEKRNQIKEISEQTKAEQREQLIEEIKRRNDLLEKFLSTKNNNK